MRIVYIKDLLFVIVVMLWIILSIVSYIYEGRTGLIISHLIFTFISGVILISAYRVNKFSIWIDKKIK